MELKIHESNRFIIVPAHDDRLVADYVISTSVAGQIAPPMRRMETHAELVRPDEQAAVPVGLVPSLAAETPRPFYSFAKRAIDIAVSATALLILIPILIVAAMLVRISSPGAIIFRQPRVGKGQRMFTCYKFRSMVPGAEAMLANDKRFRIAFKEGWKMDNDPRITPIGKFLRRSSMDELPQLINVLKGDMSLVGPRPVQRQEMDEQYGSYAPIVTSVLPGITGLWQVSGRSNLSYDERIALDLDYIRNRSLAFDLKIIARTLPALILSRGAK